MLLIFSATALPKFRDFRVVFDIWFLISQMFPLASASIHARAETNAPLSYRLVSKIFQSYWFIYSIYVHEQNAL